MDTSPVDVADLVRQAQAGDREAFNQLAVSQIDRLYATAYLMLRSSEPARDATQDALLNAWRGLPGLRDPHRFGPWLHRLLLRSCSRQRQRADREIEFPPAAPIAVQDATGLLADRDELMRGFRRLSTDMRMVLVMRYYLDWTVEAVADALDLPAGTVKSRTARALAALRAALDADARPSHLALEASTNDRH
jgi:RNA polymerase sigma-70 factor (ECF subfamily)